VRREAFHDLRVQRNAVGKRGAAAGERGLTRQMPTVLPPSSHPTPRSQPPAVTERGGGRNGAGKRAHRADGELGYVSALAPGAFCTGTPREVHAATSMLAVPTPCLTTPLRRGAAARWAPSPAGGPRR
jgi:hypothetical protein